MQIRLSKPMILTLHRSSIISSRPCSAAPSKGQRPPALIGGWCKSAPRSNSSAAILQLPLMAASCSAVAPSQRAGLPLWSVPLSRRSLTISRLPTSQAPWSGVRSIRQVAGRLTSAPRSRNSLTKFAVLNSIARSIAVVFEKVWNTVCSSSGKLLSYTYSDLTIVSGLYPALRNNSTTFVLSLVSWQHCSMAKPMEAVKAVESLEAIKAVESMEWSGGGTRQRPTVSDCKRHSTSSRPCAPILMAFFSASSLFPGNTGCCCAGL